MTPNRAVGAKMRGVPVDVAIVTAAVARAHDEDLGPTRAALEARGATTATVDWHDPSVDWSAFGLVLVRSPWDYTQRLREYLAWIDVVAGVSRLVNEPTVLRWCSDKHYLADLADRGAPVIPTTLIHPGEVVRLPDAAELVVKPAVSAGSRDTERHPHERRDAAIAHVERLLAAGRDVVVQPYIPSVDRRGETAVICFDGVPSHAVRKGPILRDGVREVVGDLYAAEDISPRSATPAELDAARRVLALLPVDDPPTYARIDLVEGGDGEPLLLEVEANEPSLFLDHAPGAADRYASAVLRRLG
jgi:O-ureido-D-serine cyclo-ligase